MKVEDLKKTVENISVIIDENLDYLTKLDQQSGDGDLGVSMSNGFHEVVKLLSGMQEPDFGKVLNQCGNCLNEASPSSLGTILAFWIKGMARRLKGCQEVNLEQIADAMLFGLESVSQKVGSKPGEKTILDSLYPGALELKKSASEMTEKAALCRAAKAAELGSEKTKEMKAVWGRAAYYGEKSIGMLDGGAVVGKLIFQGLIAQKSEGVTSP